MKNMLQYNEADGMKKFVYANMYWAPTVSGTVLDTAVKKTHKNLCS